MSTAASKCLPLLHFENDANGTDMLVTNEASNELMPPYSVQQNSVGILQCSFINSKIGQ